MLIKQNSPNKISLVISSFIFILFLISFVSVLPKDSHALGCSVNGNNFVAGGQMVVNANSFPSNSGDRDFEIRLFGTSGTNIGQPTTIQIFKPNSTSFPLTVTLPNVSQGTYDIELRDTLATINVRCAQDVSISNNGAGTGSDPSCSLGKSSVAMGENITVTGRNLVANSIYDIYSGNSIVGSATADSSQSFSTTIQISKEGSSEIKLVPHIAARDLPCGVLTVTPLNQGENPCGASGTCPTAIGDIPTSPTALAAKVLSLGIGVGGGLALILMVVGSIRVLTSSGDQQRLSGGRDMIVAAVSGLLFLIFSVLILEFIGVQILRLPFG